MQDETRERYEEFLTAIRETHAIQSAQGILSWDMHTKMPPGGAGLRGTQLAALTGIVHDRITDDRLHDQLRQLEEARDELDVDARVNVREMRRAVDRARKVPRELQQQISRTQSEAQQAWVAAKQKADFAQFAPVLEKMMELRRREADAIGYETIPYDALLDGYEPYMTSAEIERIFAGLRPRLVEIAERIRDAEVSPRREIVRRHFPRPQQEQFGLWVIRRLGFDLSRGRVDTAPHPFTSGGHGDTRLTLRYDESYLPGTLFGLIHEAGHGLYDQGLDPAHHGTPRGESVSLGIHESQSRMWENLVGRSLPFWKFAFPFLQAFFPEQTADVTVEEWYAAVNDVRPSLIRVEADEVTYNLHIILRFEIEKALLDRTIEVADLPGIWNEKMRAYLGITPESDAVGVLQDVHWSMGLVGYFPTYALGNLYAAQLFAAAQKGIPDFWARIEGGEFQPLLAWLQEKIHRPGMTDRATELVERVSGEAPNPDYLIDHLRGKFAPLYGWA
ncbi:MAG: carboxypeptidase M32 [Candidatus Eisenbacteria bacterium]|nr:carboxypeptidase M32 [Candidatus Eisenbacteria bacterium]